MYANDEQNIVNCIKMEINKRKKWTVKINKKELIEVNGNIKREFCYIELYLVFFYSV